MRALLVTLQADIDDPLRNAEAVDRQELIARPFLLAGHMAKPVQYNRAVGRAHKETLLPKAGIPATAHFANVAVWGNMEEVHLPAASFGSACYQSTSLTNWWPVGHSSSE